MNFRKKANDLGYFMAGHSDAPRWRESAIEDALQSAFKAGQRQARAEATAAERERVCQIIEANAERNTGWPGWSRALRELAAAIRAETKGGE